MNDNGFTYIPKMSDKDFPKVLQSINENIIETAKRNAELQFHEETIQIKRKINRLNLAERKPPETIQATAALATATKVADVTPLYAVALSDTEGIGTVKAEFAEIKIPEPQGVVIEGEAFELIKQIAKNTGPKTVEKAVYRGTLSSGMQVKADEEDPIEEAHRLKQAGRTWSETAHTLADEYPNDYSADDSEKIRKAEKRRFPIKRQDGKRTS